MNEYQLRMVIDTLIAESPHMKNVYDNCIVREIREIEDLAIEIAKRSDCLDESVDCNCENSLCLHQGMCSNKTIKGTNRIVFLGEVCNLCYSNYSPHFKLTNSN